MYFIIGFVCAIIGLYTMKKSTLQKEFERDSLFYEGNKQEAWKEKELPALIQMYLETTNLRDYKECTSVNIKYKDVSFAQSKKGPFLKMDYEQMNFSQSFNRISYMKSSMFGILFEGYDSYREGQAGMQGVLAKFIPLFHQKGKELEQGTLVTILAESLLLPNILYSPNIDFEQISENQVKGTLKKNHIEVSGIFTFNEQKEYVSFFTEKRAQVDNKGNVQYLPWIARCENYQKDEQGFYRPTQFKAIWKEEEEEFVYFDGKIDKISYK